jgi:hypothetical protein
MKFQLLILFLFLVQFLFSQTDQVKIATVGFYNLENLFDTENDTLINDEEFLPDGHNRWTEDKYQEKLTNMAYVISQIGIETVPSGLSILGVSEIENRKVLEDLVNQPSIKDRNYKIVHHDSPDKRGIDVGLLYNPEHFKLTRYSDHEVNILYNGKKGYTRDVLLVSGLLDGEEVHILVNHWPSRRGGEQASAPNRLKAAIVNRKIVDSLMLIDPDAKIIIMGDLNDDPTNISVKNGLRAARKKRGAKTTGLYNPMYDFYRRGIGSNAYRDNWSLFDQLIISEGLLNDDKGYHYFKANVFNKRFLIQRSGRYKDYPFRTFSGNTYQGGYSDHFPVYMYLIKKV